MNIKEHTFQLFTSNLFNLISLNNKKKNPQGIYYIENNSPSPVSGTATRAARVATSYSLYLLFNNKKRIIKTHDMAWSRLCTAREKPQVLRQRLLFKKKKKR